MAVNDSPTDKTDAQHSDDSDSGWEELANGGEEGITLSCPHCPQWWTYTGDRDRATCPNCCGGVDVEKHAVRPELMEAFEEAPHIDHPEEREREVARFKYPPAVVPESGPIPDPFHEFTTTAVFGVPDWVVESVVSRFERSDREVTPRQVDEWAYDYTQVWPEHITEPGHEDLHTVVKRRIEGTEAVDGPDLPTLTDEERARIIEEQGLRGRANVHADIDLPAEVWEVAHSRAVEADDLERLEAYLFDYLSFEYRFLVDGEEVYRTERFDPEGIVREEPDDGDD